MARLQSRAQNEQHDDVENVLQSFHEWMVKKAQADRNRKISSGRNDAAKENPYIPPTIASPGPSIVPNQQATIEEISGSKNLRSEDEYSGPLFTVWLLPRWLLSRGLPTRMSRQGR